MQRPAEEDDLQTGQEVNGSRQYQPQIASELGFEDPWSDSWTNLGYYFPEPTDYQVWEGLVENLAAGR